MSGGHFDYNQHYVHDIVMELKELIKKKGIGFEEYFEEYSAKTLKEFKKGLDLLRQAEIYVQRIDWLVSGDDGEDTFHERLEEDLSELQDKKRNENIGRVNE